MTVVVELSLGEASSNNSIPLLVEKLHYEYNRD
jgi:hypothetical protein